MIADDLETAVVGLPLGTYPSSTPQTVTGRVDICPHQPTIHSFVNTRPTPDS